MAKEKAKDLFSNVAFGTVTESAINTLTFAEISTGVSVREKIAWIIGRILWYPAKLTMTGVHESADMLDMALTSSNKVDDISSLSDPAVIDLFSFGVAHYGTAGSGERYNLPFVRDFTALPGGGLIITPKPLYIAAKATSMAAAATVSCRIFYTIKTLAADEFWELVQASRIVQ
jgi:hypothetical protein